MRKTAEEVKRDRFTVYPNPWAVAVIGRSAPTLNNAIECWASMIARASEANDERFSKEEWITLADVCYAFSVDADDTVGAVLSEMILSRIDDEKIAKPLAKKCVGLAYSEGWALLLSVQTFWLHRQSVKTKDAWWTIGFRQRVSLSDK